MSKSSETDSTPISAEMSSFNEIYEFLSRPENDQVGYYILSPRRTHPIFSFAFRTRASSSILLFSSALVAREVAYMLRGDWDGLNAVTIYQPDAVAVQNVLALLKLELGIEEVNYCQRGEDCSVLVLPPIQVFSAKSSGKSVLMAEFLMQFSVEGIEA